VRWIKNLFFYGGTDSFWLWFSLVIVGGAIAGSVWALHCDVSRLIDVLERTHCACEVERRPDNLLR